MLSGGFRCPRPAFGLHTLHIHRSAPYVIVAGARRLWPRHLLSSSRSQLSWLQCPRFSPHRAAGACSQLLLLALAARACPSLCLVSRAHSWTPDDSTAGITCDRLPSNGSSEQLQRRPDAVNNSAAVPNNTSTPAEHEPASRETRLPWLPQDTSAGQHVTLSAIATTIPETRLLLAGSGEADSRPAQLQPDLDLEQLLPPSAPPEPPAVTSAPLAPLVAATAPEVHHLAAILKKRTSEVSGMVEYLVQWDGYSVRVCTRADLQVVHRASRRARVRTNGCTPHRSAMTMRAAGSPTLPPTA